jgi:hypothetical protein
MNAPLFITGLLLAQAPAPAPPPLPHPVLPPAGKRAELPPPWWIPWAAGLLILVLLIALIIVLLTRPKHAPAAPLRQPWSAAFRALSDLRARIESITSITKYA